MNEAVEVKIEEKEAGKKRIRETRNGKAMLLKHTAEINPFFEGVLRRYHLGENNSANEKKPERLLNDGVYDSANMALYSYASNNPFIYIDPLGLVVCRVGIDVVNAICAAFAVETAGASEAIALGEIFDITLGYEVGDKADYLYIKLGIEVGINPFEFEISSEPQKDKPKVSKHWYFNKILNINPYSKEKYVQDPGAGMEIDIKTKDYSDKQKSPDKDNIKK